ncbi:MAG: hypothetical protein DYG89_36455 [Caldilinea sp. CFX5]|nr:hypothetical protein [Caldilinea sp. CFX5]
MASTTLYRLSALALLLCWPLALVGNLANPGIDIALVNHPLWTPMHALVLAAYALALLGLPGLYARLGSQMGILGLIGFAFYMLRLATSIGSKVYDLVIKPTLAGEPAARALATGDGPLRSLYGEWGIVLSLLFAVGTIGFGIAILRLSWRARWAGLLIILGSVGTILLPPVGLVIREAGLAWLGATLWQEQRAAQPGEIPLRDPVLSS